jgi:hypothetical protein
MKRPVSACGITGWYRPRPGHQPHPEATARFYQRPDVVHRPVTGVSPGQIGVAWTHTRLVDDAVDAFILSCRALCGNG